MTNGEYYKDTIEKFLSKHEKLAVKSGQPVTCMSIKCIECDLGTTYPFCYDEFIYWMYEEHPEKKNITLTKKQRLFCEMMSVGAEEGYLVKVPYNDLYYCEFKPERRNGDWYLPHGYGMSVPSWFVDFPFISTEDEEAWSLKELLKLHHE